jgi:hypothetical protein
MPTESIPYFAEPIYAAAANNLSDLLNTPIITIRTNEIQWSIFTQGILVIALATVLLYFAISGYYVSYFRKLSLPFNSMDLPFSFYLHAGHWIGLTILIIFVPSLYAMIFPQIVSNSILHLMIVLIMLLFLIWFAWSHTKTPKWAAILVLLIIAIFIDLIKITDIVVHFEESMRAQSDFGISLSSVIIVFLLPCLLYSIFRALGWAVATRLVRGDADSLKIELVPAEETHLLSDKALMLVLHSGGMYYLVGRSECQPSHATSYIIPDNQIKMATITTVGAKDAALSHNVQSIAEAYENNDLKCTLALINEMLMQRVGKMDKAALKTVVDAAIELIAKLDNRKQR